MRTKQIRLTSAVTVLSTDDPVRVFEEFATVDLLSRGRAELTAGRGSFTESYPLFGCRLGDPDRLAPGEARAPPEGPRQREGHLVREVPCADPQPRGLSAAGAAEAPGLGGCRWEPGLRRTGRAASLPPLIAIIGGGHSLRPARRALPRIGRRRRTESHSKLKVAINSAFLRTSPRPRARPPTSSSRPYAS
ncbi:MAG: LLM class flavin-dependent oxidoreductase [Dehalococcoidia bacterium]|nr:LLM class flavin-dependent oxidoreductase [Dehalococcoidia bacterium]